MTTKVATTWNPQPLGFGYENTSIPLPLVTETGAKLVTELAKVLTTGSVTFAGKSLTTWSDTGA